jgi:hypothetical protein
LQLKNLERHNSNSLPSCDNLCYVKNISYNKTPADQTSTYFSYLRNVEWLSNTKLFTQYGHHISEKSYPWVLILDDIRGVLLKSKHSGAHNTYKTKNQKEILSKQMWKAGGNTKWASNLMYNEETETSS